VPDIQSRAPMSMDVAQQRTSTIVVISKNHGLSMLAMQMTMPIQGFTSKHMANALSVFFFDRSNARALC
jgi:hypothetical protein